MQFIRSYLSQRQQFTQSNHSLSNLKLIEYGVPQGSVLGPLLFIVFINHLPKTLTKSKITLNADDATIMTHENSKSSNSIIQDHLNKTDDWFKQNNFTINSKKSKLMKYGVYRGTQEVLVGNPTVERVKDFKNIGIWTDEKLTFEYYTDKVLWGNWRNSVACYVTQQGVVSP